MNVDLDHTDVTIMHHVVIHKVAMHVVAVVVILVMDIPAQVRIKHFFRHVTIIMFRCRRVFRSQP